MPQNISWSQVEVSKQTAGTTNKIKTHKNCGEVSKVWKPIPRTKRSKMPLLCRENECKRLCQLLCGGDVEWVHTKLPPAIFIHGGPQTGKKSLVSSVLKNLHTKEGLNRKGRHTYKIRSALLSCHLGSVGSSALFEEMWRQINTEHVKGNVKLTKRPSRFVLLIFTLGKVLLFV